MKRISCIVIIILSVFSSCKNDTVGDLRIINESNDMIWVKFSSNGTDTVIGQIESKTDFVIKIFDVKGNPRKFSCCPCQTNVYYIYNSAGKIKRDVSKSENWTIPGKNSLSLNGTDQVRCEFKVKQEDL